MTSSNWLVFVIIVAAGCTHSAPDGYAPGIYCVAYCSEGEAIAFGSRDHTVRIWTPTGHEQVPIFCEHSGAVLCLSVSPDGDSLASAGVDADIFVSNVRTGKKLLALSGHSGAVWSVAFAHDGKLLASGGSDGTVRIWSFPAGRQIMTLKEDGASVNTVGFSPDGLLLASGGDDRTVRLWEVSTGLSLRRLSGHRGSIANVAFSNDGQLVASVGGALNTEDSGRFGEVKIWDTQTGDPVCDLGSHDAGVRSVAFAPRSGLIATGDLDGMLRLWDLRVAEQRWALKTESPVFSIAFSPDGESLAVGGSYSRRVQLYDPITGSPKAVDSSN